MYSESYIYEITKHVVECDDVKFKTPERLRRPQHPRTFTFLGMTKPRDMDKTRNDLNRIRNWLLDSGMLSGMNSERRLHRNTIYSRFDGKDEISSRKFWSLFPYASSRHIKKRRGSRFAYIGNPINFQNYVPLYEENYLHALVKLLVVNSEIQASHKCSICTNAIPFDSSLYETASLNEYLMGPNITVDLFYRKRDGSGMVIMDFDTSRLTEDIVSLVGKDNIFQLSVPSPEATEILDPSQLFICPYCKKR